MCEEAGDPVTCHWHHGATSQSVHETEPVHVPQKCDCRRVEPGTMAQLPDVVVPDNPTESTLGVSLTPMPRYL
jgi:hypothetical protein